MLAMCFWIVCFSLRNDYCNCLFKLDGKDLFLKAVKLPIKIGAGVLRLKRYKSIIKIEETLKHNISEI